VNTALKATGNTSKLEKIYPIYLSLLKLKNDEKSVSTGKLFQMLTTEQNKPRCQCWGQSEQEP